MANFQRNVAPRDIVHALRIAVPISIGPGLPRECQYVPGDWMVMQLSPTQQFLFVADASFRLTYVAADALAVVEWNKTFPVVCSEWQPMVPLESLVPGADYLVVLRTSSAMQAATSCRGTLCRHSAETLIIDDAAAGRVSIPCAAIQYAVALTADTTRQGMHTRVDAVD